MPSNRPLLYLCTDPGIPLFGCKGSSTHVREMARAFAALGREVWLAVSGRVDGSPPDFPCRIVPLPVPSGRSARWLGYDGRHWLGSRRATRRLMRQMVEVEHYDIYERYSLYAATGEALARRFGLRRVVEVNAFLSEESRGRLHFPGRARAVERRLLGDAPALTAISVVMRDRLVEELGVPPVRIQVSPMAIDPDRFHPGVRPFPEARPLCGPGAGEAGFVVGYVGSFNHYHRPGWLIDLAEALEAKGIRATLVVIGGPSQKVERHRAEARERGVAGRIRYLGELAHEALPAWMAAFDLAVVPGAAPQSSPTKIIEAAAVGVPQVVPDTRPIRYLLEGLGDWAFFPPEDRVAFGERVAGVLERLSERRQEARSLAPQVAARHSWSSRAREILFLFDRQGV